jgi:hypothetical protein
MNITLSWDLFVIVFFAVIVTYSFIIGKKESVKIIIATYIAAVTVQGIGNLLARVAGPESTILPVMGVALDLTVLAIVKLILFIAAIIVLAIKSGLDVRYAKEPGMIMSLVMAGVFGFATAGLLLSTMLTYVAGAALLDVHLAQHQTLVPLLAQSQLLQFLILYQEFWYVGPAIILLVMGLLHNK